MQLKRYNLGFGFFGPLEQHANGKLIKAEDADKAMAAMLTEVLQAQAESEAYQRATQALDIKLKLAKERAEYLDGKYQIALARAEKEAASANFYFVLNIALLVATVCGETYRYFSGN